MSSALVFGLLLFVVGYLTYPLGPRSRSTTSPTVPQVDRLLTQFGVRAQAHATTASSVRRAVLARWRTGIGGGQGPVAGVHSGGKAAVGRDPGEQGAELLALGGVEGG